MIRRKCEKNNKKRGITADMLHQKVKASFPQKDNYEQYMDIVLIVNEMILDETGSIIIMDSTDRILAKELVEKTINSMDFLNAERENANAVICKIFYNALSALYSYNKNAWKDSMRTICGWKLAIEILKNIEAECIEDRNFTKENILKKMDRIDKEKYLEAAYSNRDITNEIAAMVIKK